MTKRFGCIAKWLTKTKVEFANSKRPLKDGNLKRFLVELLKSLLQMSVFNTEYNAYQII